MLLERSKLFSIHAHPRTYMVYQWAVQYKRTATYDVLMNWGGGGLGCKHKKGLPRDF